jgi:hypothetical protein
LAIEPHHKHSFTMRAAGWWGLLDVERTRFVARLLKLQIGLIEPGVEAVESPHKGPAGQKSSRFFTTMSAVRAGTPIQV